MAERTTVGDEERLTSRGAVAAQWFSLLAPPVAFLAQLEANFAMVRPLCARDDRLPLHLVTLGAILVCAAALLVAWRAWRSVAGPWPDYVTPAPSPRSRFMAALGMLTSGLFLVLLLAQAIPAFVLSPCQ